MDLNIINSFLFHPRKSYHAINEKDILITVEDDVQISTRFHLISKSAPTILFFHGNGEIAPEYDDIAAMYKQQNINFIIADFRGYGFSNGTPTAENTQSDVHPILDYVLWHLKKENYIGPLILMGRSLGSVSGLELARRYPGDFSALIIESGFANEGSLFNLFGITAGMVGYKKEDGFQNGAKISKYPGPLLVIHAEQDHIIPFSQGEELLNLCPSKNKKLVGISNANHNNILGVNPLKYFEEVSRFIENCNK